MASFSPTQLASQPPYPKGMAGGLPADVHATYAIGGAWYNARYRSFVGTRGFYDVTPTPRGIAWNANTNTKTIDLGVPSGTLYGFLFQGTLGIAHVTSATSAQILRGE